MGVDGAPRAEVTPACAADAQHVWELLLRKALRHAVLRLVFHAGRLGPVLGQHVAVTYGLDSALFRSICQKRRRRSTR
jgi:hypothetical protein